MLNKRFAQTFELYFERKCMHKLTSNLLMVAIIITDTYFTLDTYLNVEKSFSINFIIAVCVCVTCNGFIFQLFVYILGESRPWR